MTRADRPFLDSPSVLFVAHLAALVFGLVGLLIMLPNPDLWAERSARRRRLRLVDGATPARLHILLGAAAMFAFGVLDARLAADRDLLRRLHRLSLGSS